MNNDKETKKVKQIIAVTDRILEQRIGITNARDVQLLTLIAMGEELQEQTALLRIIAKQEPKDKRVPWYKKIGF